DVEPQSLQRLPDRLGIVQGVRQPRGVDVGGVADDEGDALDPRGRIRSGQDEEDCSQSNRKASSRNGAGGPPAHVLPFQIVTVSSILPSFAGSRVTPTMPAVFLSGLSLAEAKMKARARARSGVAGGTRRSRVRGAVHLSMCGSDGMWFEA